MSNVSKSVDFILIEAWSEKTRKELSLFKRRFLNKHSVSSQSVNSLLAIIDIQLTKLNNIAYVVNNL